MAPTRQIKDPYPSFAGVSVDAERNEVVFTDESLFQVLVYSRTENTPRGVSTSTPKRTIAGENTNIEFQSSVWVDPKTGEIYAVNNDTRDTTVVFGPGADGDVEPVRSLHTPHGAFGIVAAEPHGELLLAVQHDSAIVAYQKQSTEKDAPVRLLQGDRTRLADPHGLAYDAREDVIFVTNFGAKHSVSESGQVTSRRAPRSNWPLDRDAAVPGSGTINPPSITVYPRTASGDSAPLRVIEGPDTQLNWPTAVAFDPGERELFVANDATHQILVFDAAANGNVRPKRVIEGPATELANPTGIVVDAKNRELWVANFGGHSGTAYDLGASGNAAPKRIIRNAPEGTPSLMIGNPGAVAFDAKRENILVPN
jgi:DNA-binding beta-propeller fold protein YncE